MLIKILGRGCSRCNALTTLIEKVAVDMGVLVTLEKITDDLEIIKHGVMTTPAVMINDKIVYSGGLPSVDEIRSWIKG